ncbi:hypothetical protein AUR64_12700 [Haloprofundus marisrubri]|uniref:Uncharacterized protein n=1 Tax=Haloprofundus marisrubri TaxID=1514971 RepID=A0A0W1RAP3_9EURY|nr:hypothetical protein [Haloprofundus marisrubri]KTG10417.1 hypothetical protein AUR64_12700 [Haloprofundus marisrubri]
MPSKLSAVLASKKSALALILLSTVVLGAGYGMVNSPLGENPAQATDPTVTTNSTPDPAVTPPPTETPDGDDADGDSDTTTSEPQSTGVATPDDADDETPTDRSSDRSDESDSSNNINRADASLSLSVGTPDEIRSDDGTVETVSGTLSGSLSHTYDHADTVVFVVHSRTADGEWEESSRKTVALDGENDLDLDTAFDGQSVTYLDGDRTATFANADDGTTVERTGHVAVTAVLYDGDYRLDSLYKHGSYTVDVTNIEAQAGADAESDATVSALDGERLGTVFA